MHRRRADDLERMEARLLQHLQFEDRAEAVGLVDEAGVRTDGDPAAAVLVLVQEPHPDAVEVLPGHLVRGRPVEPVRAVVQAAGGVELGQAGQRVVRVPVGVARPHHVAAGGVDRHRRVDEEVELQELLQQGVPAFAAGLDQAPLPRHLPEAELLVHVVHLDRPGLHVVGFVHRLEQAVEVGHPDQPQPRGVDRVHVADPHLVQVSGRPHAQAAGLVQQGRHDRRRKRAELETVHALLVGVPDPLAGVRGSANVPVLPLLAAARTLIGHEARRGDLVPAAAFLLAQVPLQRPGGHAARRRDAVRHPQFVDVLRTRRLGHAARVDVQVDQSRQHPGTGEIELAVGVLRPPALVDLGVGHAEALDLLDPVALDDDVDRAHRRRAGAVDHHDAAQDQAVERTLALAVGTGRRGFDQLGLFLLGGGRRRHGRGRHGQEDGQAGAQEALPGTRIDVRLRHGFSLSPFEPGRHQDSEGRWPASTTALR